MPRPAAAPRLLLRRGLGPIGDCPPTGWLHFGRPHEVKSAELKNVMESRQKTVVMISNIGPLDPFFSM